MITRGVWISVSIRPKRKSVFTKIRRKGISMMKTDLFVPYSPGWMSLLTAGHCRTCPGRSSCSSPCPEVLFDLKEGESKRGRNTYEFHLTRQETEIMRSLLDGKSRDEIRKELKITPGAMRTAIAKLRKKRRIFDEALKEAEKTFYGKKVGHA
jgi:DNA-binding CsgD family transcriptional regulator